MSIKTLETKKSIGNFQIFFPLHCRGYMVVVGENLTHIGEYSSMLKIGENPRRYTVVSSVKG